MNAEQLKNSILQRAIEGKLVEQPEGEKIHRPGTLGRGLQSRLLRLSA